MIQMNKQLVLKAALILFLSAGPSAACDPEEMINELRAQCRDAITSAVALIEPMKPALTAPDRNTVETKIKEATELCNSDKYSEGYTVTAKLARFIGHLEARKGIIPVL
jgi:spore germination protein GerM